MKQTMMAILVLATALCGNTQTSYIFKEPVIRIDFGAGTQVAEFNAVKPAQYERVNKYCPEDGYYAYTNYTSNCFNNDWFTISGDHTGNAGGNMMLVNAVETGGIYFTNILKGLNASATYEFSVWFMNVCRINGGCEPLPPNIETSIRTLNGQLVARFKTGQLVQTNAPSWKRYSAVFTVPAGETNLALIMSNLTTGGCGNDFAMDDLLIRERVEIKANPAPAPVVQKQAARKPENTEAAKKQAKAVVEVFKQVTKAKKEAEKVIVSFPVEKPVQQTPVVQQPVFKPTPPLLMQRQNPIVKTITTGPGEMLIELYDNGQIDGDTVTIYHNNELVVANAALGLQPVTFTFSINTAEPHHEIVMVANNLGSIPPNTSLMIIKINGRRYDTNISSSESKNAKVVITLEQ